MDQTKTGALIRFLRAQHGMTQLALAERLGVSDKAVSKWERGCGAPDISILPALAETLGISTRALLRGELEENGKASGNLSRTLFYCCRICGNLLFSTDDAEVHCCGQTLAPFTARRPDAAHMLAVTHSDDEWLVTGSHEMRREHHISFVSLLTGDTLILRRLYPEWDMLTRLPYVKGGTLLWHCTRHGLFAQELPNKL